MADQLRKCKKCGDFKLIECFGVFPNGSKIARRHTCKKCRQKENTIQTFERRNTDTEFYERSLRNQKKYMKTEGYRKHLIKKRSKSAENYYGDLLFRMKRIVSAAENRAKRKNLEFSITADLLFVMIHIQDFKCAVTGVPFDFSQNDDYHKNPMGPSLDRKNSNKGYTVDNIQVVCAWYNLMKNEWSDIDVKSFIHTAYHALFED